MKYQKLFREYWREGIVVVLLLANLLTWTRVWQGRPGSLRVYFLDIGQGNAIFVDTPSHKRFMFDGGPDRKVLSEIGKILPFGDRRIDVMIESHPDQDHIGGFPEVVSRYNVGAFLEPGVESPNKVDDELRKRIKAKNIPDLLARRNMVIDFGDGAKLIILFPNQDVSTWDTNDASVVAKLEYGSQSFLFTGDSTIKAENILLSLNKGELDSDVLQAGHHGSRTSTSLPYAEAVSPTYAIISAGTKNKYGHPHQETLNILNQVGAHILATEDVKNLKGSGTIEFDTDGQNLVLK